MKQQITNTLGRPVFIRGKLLSPGMTMEVDPADLPPGLQRLALPTEAQETKPTQPEAGQEEPTAPTDEEQLVAAAKPKGK